MDPKQSYVKLDYQISSCVKAKSISLLKSLITQQTDVWCDFKESGESEDGIYSLLKERDYQLFLDFSCYRTP